MKIYEIKVSLDSQYYTHRINPIEVNETKESYVGEGKRIAKNKIMALNPDFFDNTKILRFSTYCLEGQQQEAIKTLEANISSKLEEYKKNLEALTNIEQGKSVLFSADLFKKK